MVLKILFLLGLSFSMSGAADNRGRFQLTESLQKFLGTLERYEHLQNDVVFLLDESGSIGADKFPQVKLFTKLVAQQFSVSADETRVAVVTFASKTVKHIDYITDHKGNNMCTLLKQIDDIPYVGQSTKTRLAMEEAERILDRSRPSAKKIIVLLTDGQSDGGYGPVPISIKLKNKGYIIFAIGVASVNEKEIYDVANNKDHTYILSDFNYILEVNKLLVEDMREHSLDLSNNASLCNAPCDAHAKCYCGTRSGRYECKCSAGYYGKGGFVGQCKKCPKGTYKSVSENSDCVHCPEHSTTLKEGSTSVDDCKCDSGYEKIGKICSPLKCASLSAPEGGILIPTHCNNTYGTQCSFKCNKGYCPVTCKDNPPHPLDNHIILPKRTCLETRRWSNDEFHCEKMGCSALSIPQNGMHNCSDKDFTFETTCSFTCDDGYELYGSKHRTCDFNGWTGQDTKCKEIHCEKLHTNDVLKVKPMECGTNSSPFRSVCTYFCAKGYVLLDKGNRTDGILKCKANKQWSGFSKRIECRDIEPPKIVCPKPITLNTIPDKDHAIVNWNPPNATDNLHLASLRIVRPDWLKKLPAEFPIDETKVVYEAIDLYKNSKTCSFVVKVLDKEPPKVVKCPSDIEVYHHTNKATEVTWEVPEFEDNSKKNLSFIRHKEKGKGSFAWGPPSVVTIIASDPSGNNASCTFSVKVKPYPCPYYDPPANGAVACDNWGDGRLCSIACHDGFEFARSRKNFHGIFLCNPSFEGGQIVGKWQPFRREDMKFFQMPWPDCSRKQKPAAVDASIGFGFAVDSCSEEMIEKIRVKFMQNIKQLRFPCKESNGCSAKNVNVTCKPVIARRKRSFNYGSQINFHDTVNKYTSKDRLPRQTSKQMLTVSFNVQMLVNETDPHVTEKTSSATGKDDEIDLASSPAVKEIEDVISLQVKDAYNLETAPKPELNLGVVAICSTGQITVNNSCLNCPTGTYKDDVSETCIPCRTATYQDEERQMSCKACPAGYTTYQVKSKSITDCKGPCQPGTYSETMFEPCLACPLNTYQARPEARECKKCPSGLYTWKVGANSSTDCVAPCKPGSFSDTGYKPCTLCDIGSFQDKEAQKECKLCPNRTSTTDIGSKNIDECKEIDICNDLQPCKHGSTCNQLDKDYECLCPVGLRGKHCEINPDDCDPNPCLNNGTCIDGIANFTCVCPKGWEGHQCELNRDDCQPDPCLNGAECIDKVNAYECHCVAGFIGDRCEENIYECDPNPCLNNGTCFDMLEDYRCCCSKGYTGKNCEIYTSTSACDNAVCENGATCVAHEDDSFNCLCPDGFEGDLCEINTDDCKEVQCKNGGTCIDGIGNATCKCPTKFIGLHCEEALIPEFLLNFPRPDTTNYAKAENNHTLHELTIAFFMRTSLKDSTSRSTPLSYSYDYENNIQDNALTFYDTNNLILFIHGEQFFTGFSANSDASWHHYALSWEKVNGKWVFYVDGKVFMSDKAGKGKYMHPGVFILGQEQDEVGGRFSTLEAFAGDITEFNVWDYVLTDDEIRRLSSACGYVGNIIPWYTLSHAVFGNVSVSHEVDKCKALGNCPRNSCDCFYTDGIEGYSCKYIVPDCIDENTCSYGQPCVSNGNYSSCNCRQGFEGRRCEYDIDECLENNGGCNYLCVNDVGTGSYHCECPDDLVLSEDGKLCKDTSYCIKDGQIYIDGESLISSCQNCFCEHGSFTCEDIVCNVTTCLPEETLIASPGECCPKCVAWSFCLVSPNNTILSFDLSSYEIEGACTYTAVEDCIGGRFKIQIESPEPVPKEEKRETNIVIYQDCYKVIITSNGSVVVDNTVVESSFENEQLTVEYINSSVSLKTNSDLFVQWNFRDEILISVPITDLHKICGVCSKMEEYYFPGKFALTERFASVRTFSNDFYSYILSDF